MKLCNLLLVAAFLITIPLADCLSKEKLLLLIKKLEKLTNVMGGDSGATTKQQTVSEETITIAPVTARQLKTIKPGVVKIDPVFSLDQDSAKSYCNGLECVEPTCSLKDITIWGNLRKKAPKPEIFQLCGVRMATAAFMKKARDAYESCCIYNMTLVSINNKEMWDCINEMFTRNKKSMPVPTSGGKYWTSGIYSSSCGKHAWCPEKEIIGADAKWKKGFPKDGAGDCIALQLGSSNPENNGFLNMKCSENLNYMCYGHEM